MIPNVFPRLFGQYREGAIIGGKFTISSGNGTAIAADTHRDVSLTNATGGLYILNIPKCRKATVVSLYATNPDSDDPTDTRAIFVDQELGGVDPANGKVYFGAYLPEEGAVAMALAVLPDGAQLHALVYIDR